jgi:crotonobetainyl-CoA:carnitine CoA-transferase CaiB-like acyl-CoA transferase
MPQAFSGIRVLDFTQVLAGPYATAQMAMLGADVIKIEQPKGGDQSRILLPLPGALGENGLSGIFMSVNAAKRSMTLDLKSPEAKTILHNLVEKADVVVENFKAGTMDRMGFG